VHVRDLPVARVQLARRLRRRHRVLEPFVITSVRHFFC
jgi:hypothetical protein